MGFIWLNIGDEKEVGIQPKKSFKSRRSSRRYSFLNDMGSGCLLLTPKLMRQLLNSAARQNTHRKDNAISESTLEEGDEQLVEPDIEVKTIKPSSLLRMLFSDKDTQSVEEKSKEKCAKDVKFRFDESIEIVESPPPSLDQNMNGMRVFFFCKLRRFFSGVFFLLPIFECVLIVLLFR